MCTLFWRASIPVLRFTWIEAGFPEDDTKAYSYLHTAIRKGSAIAILQAMRTSGALHQLLKKSCL